MNKRNYPNPDEHIFYCNKDDWYEGEGTTIDFWDIEKTSEFWRKIREEKMASYDYDFSDFVFPVFLDEKNDINEIVNSNSFWFRYEKREFKEKKNYPNIHFNGAVFLSFTNFCDVTFRKHVNFYSSKFKGAVNFDNSTFLSVSLFESVNFFKYSSFIRTTFSNVVQFSSAFFHEIAIFHRAIFEKKGVFYHTSFLGNADFESSEFHIESNFQSAIFTEKADFRFTNFEAHADFSLKLENEDSKKEFNKNFKEIDFNDATFYSSVNFSNRTFSEETNFSKTTFKKPPVFHNTSLHQDTNFQGATFQGFDNDNASRHFRTLKQAMEGQRARQEEMHFFYCEQRSVLWEKWKEVKEFNAKKPFKLITNLFDMVVSFLYWILNGYGGNYLRPILWIILLHIGFFYLYGHYSCSQNSDELIAFCIRQTARPFYVWSDTEQLKFFGNRLFVQSMASLQSVFSLTLLYMFLFALRKRFRIG